LVISCPPTIVNRCLSSCRLKSYVSTFWMFHSVPLKSSRRATGCPPLELDCPVPRTHILSVKSLLKPNEPFVLKLSPSIIFQLSPALNVVLKRFCFLYSFSTFTIGSRNELKASGEVISSAPPRASSVNEAKLLTGAYLTASRNLRPSETLGPIIWVFDIRELNSKEI